MSFQSLANVPGLKDVCAENAVSAGEQALRAYFEEQGASLLNAMRVFVARHGLDRREGREEAALELFSEVFSEAMKHPERFDVQRTGAGQSATYAWLMGIAANLMRRRFQNDKRERERLWRENEMSGEAAGAATQSEADEVFERVASLAHEARGNGSRPEDALDSNEAARLLLSLVSPEDAQILRLAVLHEMSGEQLAERLQISPINARVKLHRALNRLRNAVRKQGGYYA